MAFKPKSLLTVSVFFFSCLSSYGDQKEVIWTPRTAEVSILPGTTTTLAVNFHCTRPISHALLHVSRDLRTFVSLNQTSEFTNILAGETGSLVLLISVPAKTVPAEYHGTLHLAHHRHAVPAVLKIIIHVRKPDENAVPPGIALPSPDRIAQLPDGTSIVEDEAVISLRAGTSNPDTVALHIAKMTGGIIVGSDPLLSDYQIRYSNADFNELQSLLPTLNALPDVDFAILHYLSSAALTPNDPLFTNSSQWAINYIDAPDAWDVNTGNTSVVVGVIDRDFDPGHPDLAANVISPITPAPGLLNSGHGTNVAGIIGAVGNNNLGVTGVAWKVSMRFYDCGVTGVLGLPLSIDSLCVANSMVTAARQGARIVNLSASAPDAQCGNSPPIDNTTASSVAKLWEKAIALTMSSGNDVLWVFAAGNGCRDASNESGPLTAHAFPDNAIVVGSIGQTGQASSFSNYGTYIDVSAPGEQILSTVPRYCLFGLDSLCVPNPTWSSLWAPMTGTSQAAPHVSGLAALVRSQYPNASAAMIKKCIVDAAVPNGVINARAALQCELSSPALITTIAGNGTPGYSGDGGPATSAQLSAPFGVAVDTNGNLFVSDARAYSVREIDHSTGNIRTIAGNGTYGYSGDGGLATQAQLNQPEGITLDSSNNLYIADSLNDVVRDLNLSGVISTFAGGGQNSTPSYSGPALGAELLLPTGVAADLHGNVFIADSSTCTIRKVDVSGTMVTVAGGAGSKCGYSGDGGPATSATLAGPHSVAIDSNGNLFIADWANNVIRKVDLLGIITTVVGTGMKGYTGDGQKATNAELNSPAAVVVDSDGNLFIADTSNNVVRRVDTSGIITTIAGTGVAGYSGDNGPAAAAQLNFPTALAFDANGDLYIADGLNHVVRKVTSP